MLDLLVIWGHSSDDSISNPQVWRNRACKHAGLTQHSSNPDTYFPPVACLFITYYSFPPMNILASLIIILKEISCQLFLFSCLFQDHVPSQWENKKKNSNRNLMEVYMGSPSVAWVWVTGSESCDSHCPSRK